LVGSVLAAGRCGRGASSAAADAPDAAGAGTLDVAAAPGVAGALDAAVAPGVAGASGTGAVAAPDVVCAAAGAAKSNASAASAFAGVEEARIRASVVRRGSTTSAFREIDDEAQTPQALIPVGLFVGRPCGARGPHYGAELCRLA
jgi:hypothetical protein